MRTYTRSTYSSWMPSRCEQSVLKVVRPPSAGYGATSRGRGVGPPSVQYTHTKMEVSQLWILTKPNNVFLSRRWRLAGGLSSIFAHHSLPIVCHHASSTMPPDRFTHRVQEAGGSCPLQVYLEVFALRCVQACPLRVTLDLI